MTYQQGTPLHKGEIWNIKQDENNLPTGSEMWANRPAIIVSNNAINLKANFVLVVFLTTKIKRPMPYHINVQSGDRRATALCEQIFAVDKSRIEYKIGEVNTHELKEIDQSLLFSLGISNTLHPSSLFQKWINYIDKHNIDINVTPYTEPDIKAGDIMDLQTALDVIEKLKHQVNALQQQVNSLTKERDAYKTLYEMANARQQVDLYHTQTALGETP